MNFLLTIAIPFAGAVIAGIVKDRHKQKTSCVILGLTFLSAVMSMPAVLKGMEAVVFYRVFDWFSISFKADGLAVYMAIVSSLVAFIISIYSSEYMEKYPNKGAFYPWVVLFVGSMMGLIYSANLILIYIFWEITAVSSWRLIGFYRGEKDVKAANKAFLITFFGASALLAGIALIFVNYGTLELNALSGEYLPNLIGFLLLAGIISKSAQLPLQSWLPDAGVAPSPVTALLHAAVLVKIGVYVFARLFLRTFLPGEDFFLSVLVISVITILVGAGSALVSTNMKRILAYSTISQLGYIMLALSLNTESALKTAFVYILAHSLAKAGLFLSAGIVEHETGTKDITNLGGLIKTMPKTGLAYMLCAFSIIGIPPFLGFWPKFIVIIMTIQEGYIFAGALAVAGALFTLFYLFRLFREVFLGEQGSEGSERGAGVMVYSVLFLGAVSLLLGLFPKMAFNFLNQVVK
jgi:NADH:ubiquinone oxidoreductase subunit 5 (subunit L)/multisubunit Na+/H+ antiporter MnhA subunit